MTAGGRSLAVDARKDVVGEGGKIAKAKEMGMNLQTILADISLVWKKEMRSLGWSIRLLICKSMRGWTRKMLAVLRLDVLWRRRVGLVWIRTCRSRWGRTDDDGEMVKN